MEKLLEIRDQLINDVIDYSTAFNRIKKLPKAWHTKHWEELRKEHLKDACEVCGFEGSKELPLTIQHTKHPQDFKVHYQRLMDMRWNYEKVKTAIIEKELTDEAIEKHLQENTVMRGSCPECAAIVIRKNNKRDIYICKNNHEFRTPIEVAYYTKSRTTDMVKARESARGHLSYILISKAAKQLREKHDQIVGKEALLQTIVESIEYRTFKHIKTCCRRCAAIEDNIVAPTKLCTICNQHYHNIIFPTCWHCKDQHTKEQ